MQTYPDMIISLPMRNGYQNNYSVPQNSIAYIMLILRQSSVIDIISNSNKQRNHSYKRSTLNNIVEDIVGFTERLNVGMRRTADAFMSLLPGRFLTPGGAVPGQVTFSAP